jgi:hypothetical protein
MSLTNTIAAQPVSGTNCARVTSAGFNWSDDATCDPNGTTDVASMNPHLLALGSYGGPTQTRPPDVPNGVLPTVIDQGVAASQTQDQRGFQRTWNYSIGNATGGDGTDLGAVEIQGPASLATTPPSPSDNQSPVIHGTSEQNSTVQLFGNTTCMGTEIDDAPAANFASPGIAGGGPFVPNTTTPFSANTVYGTATSACSSPFNYQVRPALPTLTSTNPSSGSNDNNPKVIGTATGSSTVNLYTQAGCAGSIAATGTGTVLAGAGIPVSVPDNSTTTFYAQATGVGGTSNCTSTGLTYSEVTPPATPTLTGTSPASGSDNNTPKLLGTADSTSTVNIYALAGCAGAIAATGTGADLAGTGIAVSVPDNSTTTFSAKATGTGGDSGCSSSLSYTEVTPPPAPPATTPTPTPAPTKKKCKKGFKLKKVKGKKKCVKKKK